MVLDSTSRFKSEAAATFYIGKTGKAFWVELLNVYVRCHLNGVDIVEGVDVGCVFHYLIMFSCSQQLDLCDESSRARENVPIFLKGTSGIIIIFGDRRRRLRRRLTSFLPTKHQVLLLQVP